MSFYITSFSRNTVMSSQYHYIDLIITEWMDLEKEYNIVRRNAIETLSYDYAVREVERVHSKMHWLASQNPFLRPIPPLPKDDLLFLNKTASEREQDAHIRQLEERIGQMDKEIGKLRNERRTK